jgi:meiotically up-regulated gene 157 (Mug157) protein
MNEAEKLKKRMSHIFLKKGREGEYTKLFENVSIYNKELLLNDISLRENELPVILGFEIPAEWILLTTERIIWRYKGQIRSVENADIENVENYIEMQKRAIFLKKPDEIEVLAKSNKIIIHTEEGSSKFGIWSVLNYLVSRNKKQAV